MSRSCRLNAWVSTSNGFLLRGRVGQHGRLGALPLGRGRSSFCSSGMCCVLGGRAVHPFGGEGYRKMIAMSGNNLASEYHTNDFAWPDLYKELRSVVEDDGLEITTSTVRYRDDCWEKFHAQHGHGQFFKERRYLLREFPALGKTNPPQHFVEIGCGSGSSVLPILTSNPTCECTACDISPTAINILKNRARAAGVDKNRLRTRVLDVSKDPLEYNSPLSTHQGDCALLVFTLSAVLPEMMQNVVAHTAQSLKSNGLLLFRDYGLCDMAQLRFKPTQRRGAQLYQRLDGTFAYFFTTEEVESLMHEAGFERMECEYVCVVWKNRKKLQNMKRVFVHGVFKKI